MNYSKKQQPSIKNKLIAAVAMLLVSTIMMVSTTYAWFTLSTAPEVQGITTTVGANGNLEIALMPYDGNLSSISSAVGDTNKNWYTTWDAEGNPVVGKNNTWGNLLDLSEGYSLGEISLLPSQLYIDVAGTATTKPHLADSPLKIPTYGADGRLNALATGEVQYGAKEYAEDPSVDGFIPQSGSGFGVRAVGTSSTRSEAALNFQTALSAVNSSKRSANTILSNSFVTYGNALGAIALKHANAGNTDTNNYATYVKDLQGMVEELVKAENAVEDALYNALLALANTEYGSNTTVTNGMSVYETIKNAQDTGIALDSLWKSLDSSAAVALLTITFPELTESYNKWQAANTQITATKSAVDALADKTNVSYSEMATALSGLMNMDNITINGMSIDDAKANAGSLIGGSGVNLQLNTNSGVFATFGELTGNISNTIVLEDGVQFGSVSLTGAKINITTTTEPAEGALLDQTRTAIAVVGAKQETGNDKSVIDTTYGYALDFVFRTNAANSSLLLQTAAAQRIYGDSQNDATMGGGSTMSFDGTLSNLQSLVNMMSGIRVVFTQTNGGDIYGIAKADVTGKPLVLVADKMNAANDKVETEDTQLPLLLTATTAGLTWTNQGVADTVEITTGTDLATQETYTQFTVKPVIPDGLNGPLKIDTTGTIVVYRVYDQDITLEGDLRLYTFGYNKDTGMLTFDETPMATQTLQALDQNVATAMTALVYLDGDYIDNSDVINSEDGISSTGVLNLQFASSANLVPMNNTVVKEGVGVAVSKLAEGWSFQGELMTQKEMPYTFTIGAPTGATATVTYSVGGVDKGVLTGNNGSYTIDAANVTGSIVITVTPDEVPETTDAATETTDAATETTGETTP